jgi:tryptophanyl-tRNA synthetase
MSTRAEPTRRKRLLTGDRPTGKLHLGHYVGTLAQRVQLQDTHDVFLVIADYHMLTTHNHRDQIAQAADHIRDVVLDYLSVGIDPAQVTIYVQSQVPQVCELQVLLSMLVSVARAQRMPTLKEVMTAQHIAQPSMGLLSYPILQAADILLMRADTVPIGKDQVAHVELCRDLARRFNRLYGQVFAEPEALLSDVPLLVGTDGQAKMSKSQNNAIFLSDSDDAIYQKVMRMYTDSTRIHATDPGHVEGNPVFTYHDVFNPDRDAVDDLKQRYRRGQIGDVEVKQQLYQALQAFLAPIRTRRARYAAEPQLVEELLRQGQAMAALEAEQTMQQVRQAMGLTYRGENGDPIAYPF